MNYVQSVKIIAVLRRNLLKLLTLALHYDKMVLVGRRFYFAFFVYFAQKKKKLCTPHRPRGTPCIALLFYVFCVICSACASTCVSRLLNLLYIGKTTSAKRMPSAATTKSIIFTAFQLPVFSCKTTANSGAT